VHDAAAARAGEGIARAQHRETVEFESAAAHWLVPDLENEAGLADGAELGGVVGHVHAHFLHGFGVVGKGRVGVAAGGDQ